MKRKMKFLCLTSLIVLSLTGCDVKKNENDKPIADTEPIKEVELMENKESLEEIKFKEVRESVYVYDSIPKETLDIMVGKSIPNENVIDDVISRNTLVKVPYINFDEEPCLGELIIDKRVAKEVSEIFVELYDNKVQIEEISLVDKYDANDIKSMTANNSSSFNYRVIAGTNVLSNHGKGLAIDINPLYNPHVLGGKASPSAGQKYADRTLEEKGMIKEGDIVYNAFIKRGWKWGGHWKNPDYQHFEKEV